MKLLQNRGGRILSSKRLDPDDLTTEEWYQFIDKAWEYYSLYYADLLNRQWIGEIYFGINDCIMPISTWVTMRPSVSIDEFPFWDDNYEVKDIIFSEGVDKKKECYRLAHNVLKRTDYCVEYDIFFTTYDVNLRCFEPIVRCLAKYINRQEDPRGISADFQFMPFKVKEFLQYLKNHRELGLGLQIIERLRDLFERSSEGIIEQALIKSMNIRDVASNLAMMQKGFFP